VAEEINEETADDGVEENPLDMEKGVTSGVLALLADEVEDTLGAREEDAEEEFEVTVPRLPDCC
jgi:hypothetical protein